MKDPRMKEPQQSPHFPDSFYRVSAKGLYVRDNKLLLCRDSHLIGEDPFWELPGGGIDFGEDPRDTLQREMKEEMGVAPSFIATAPTYVWSSRVEDRRGMDWFYTLTLAYRIEGLDLHEYVASEESTELRFFSKEDLNELSLNTQMEPLRSFFDPKDFV